LSSGACGDLVADLERRFRVVTDTVQVGAGEVRIMRPDSADELISEADFAIDERLPYWAALWPAAIVLANAIARGEFASPQLARAQEPIRAIELGCGIGLVTTAAAKAGIDILGTDYYPPSLEFTRANSCTNTGAEAKTQLVNWRELPAGMGRFELLFASDVVYEREYAGLLPRVFDKLLQFDGRAIISDPGRVATPAFLHACTLSGFKVLEKKTLPWEAGAIKQKIDIYTIAR